MRGDEHVFVSRTEAGGALRRTDDDRTRILDKFVRQFGDVDQTVLMNADVDESPEGRDVGDDARQKHSLAQVADRVHVGVECEDLQLFARFDKPNAAVLARTFKVGLPIGVIS